MSESKVPLQIEMEIRDALSSVEITCTWTKECTGAATHILTHKNAEPKCSEYACDECTDRAKRGLAMLILSRISGADPDAHLHCQDCGVRFEINEAILKEI